MLPEPRLLFITDRGNARAPLPEVTRATFAGGCRWLMLREKDLGRAERITLARELVRLAAPFGATLVINGEAEEAREAGAGGVHLPAARCGRGAVAAARAVLGVGKTVGVSVHSLAEARAAAREAPDYLLFAPVFASLSKPGHGPGEHFLKSSLRPSPPPGPPHGTIAVGGRGGGRGPEPLPRK
jgi:thiamine-phosphate pyrophosphorylase